MGRSRTSTSAGFRSTRETSQKSSMIKCPVSRCQLVHELRPAGQIESVIWPAILMITTHDVSKILLILYMAQP